MPATTDARAWTPYRPRALTQRDERVWTVDDDIPGITGVTRRMSIVRRSDGSLLFFNAIPVPEETLAAVRSLGTPAALIVPNRYHALDAAPFAEKLGVPAFAPAVAIAPLAERVRCRPISELPADAVVQVVTIDGFSTDEVCLVIGGTLIVGDVVTNAPHGRGLYALMMRFIGFTGPEPRLPPPVRKRVGRDMNVLRRNLRALAQTPGLARLIPSHGDVFEGNVPAALERIAAGV
ncbi:MAG: hypothetical protein JNG84_10050 [Archangium sp.]|nr:hypothetical protein [Archangium sp.]